MAAAGVQQMLYLLDEAFEGNQWHSLLANLHSITGAEWQAVSPNGRRTIRAIVQHVGSCKWMYENHAFGDGTMAWDHPLVEGGERLAAVASAIDWLREGQQRLRRSIADLDDAELPRPRRTNWGEWKETRWLIAVMIQHDLYHAGEINHLRSLLQQTDRWKYEGATL